MIGTLEPAREGFLAGYIKTWEELHMELFADAARGERGLPGWTYLSRSRWMRLKAWLGAQFDRLLEALHEALDPKDE